MDQPATITTGGTTRSFTADPYGNLTGDAQSGADVTGYTYDALDRLTRIDSPGEATDATFTLDALGRLRTRVLSSGGTDTYGYQGTTETVVEIANSVSGTTRSVVDAAGTRLGVRVGTTVNWLLADLHGSVAGGLTQDATALAGAIRYDAWGRTTDSDQPGSVGSGHFRYQGRLDVGPTATPLYEMGARFYAPGLGAFTQLDTYGGQAGGPAVHEPVPVCGGEPGDLHRSHGALRAPA